MRVKGKKMRKKKTYNLPNPINSNPSHDAEHTVYIAGTGGGKTSAVKHIGLVPKSAQTVFFDPYRNYADDKFRGQMCHSTSSRAVFLKALVIARCRGESFKLAYVPSKGAASDELEFFCSAVWSVGNGKAQKLHCVIEELASCTETTAKLDGKAGELLRGGRQFGIVVHTVFQSAAEVPKTVTKQSPIWFIGAVNSTTDAKWLEDRRGVAFDEVCALVSAKVNKEKIGKPIAEYLLAREGIGNIKKGAFNCATGAKVALNYR